MKTGGDAVVADAETRDCSQQVKNLSHGRVLVVDDEPLVCWSVAETLEDAGYDVVEAYDAASALDACTTRTGCPDVILLDLCLPDSTDLGLLSTLHGLAPLTPVVIVTAFASPELRDEARRLGAAAVLDKPVEMSALPPLVARLLATRR
jgi:DNA-binding NtrC family response regulator